MKKYRVTALPKMQDGGEAGMRKSDIKIPKKKKSKYDIESQGFFTSDMDAYQDLYEAYSDSTDSPTMDGFIDFFSQAAKEYGYLVAPRMNEDGTASFEAFDYNTVFDKMRDSGVRPKQMSEKMNMGDRKYLENLLKDEIEGLDQYYRDANKAKLNQLIAEGMEPEEAINELYKKGMGTKEGLKNIFYDDTLKMQDDYLEQLDKYYYPDKFQTSFVPNKGLAQTIQEQADKESERAKEANRKWNLDRATEAVSDTFSPYAEKRYENLAQGYEGGLEDNSNEIIQYGTELQDHYRDIINNSDMSKAQKIRAISDLEGSLEMKKDLQYTEDMLNAGYIKENGQWYMPRQSMREITDEEMALREKQKESWNIKNPYRKASLFTKLLHPIDSLGHLAKYGHTDNMMEEDSAAGIWEGNNVMQALDMASYVAPFVGQIRAAQLFTDGIRGVGNIARYENKTGKEADMYDYMNPAINLAVGSLLRGPQALKKGVDKVLRRNVLNQRPEYFKGFKNFNMNPNVKGVGTAKDYMNMNVDMPFFSGAGAETLLSPLGFDDFYKKMGGITKGKSKIQGDGMFTTRPFREGEMIGLAHKDDQPATELGRMHNHDEANPTMISRKIGNQRYVFANRDLEAGEELTTNYRMQPELEQPEDFQKGGQIPKAQRGLGNIAASELKTLRGIKEALPHIYPGFVPSPVMNPTELARFKDLNTLLSEYGFSGIPKNISRSLSIEDIEKFRDIQRNASRQKLKTILQNANVTKQDLITILGNPGYNKTLLKGQTDFDMAGNPIVTYGEDFAAAERARQEIESLSANELLSRVERAILNTQEKGLIKPSFEARFDRSASSALEDLERANAFEVDSAGYPGRPAILQASGLTPGEQIYFDFANNSDFRDSVPVKEAIISLFGNSHGTKQELFDDYGYKLNRGFWRARPNTIVTGSLDTSDDSYLMQMGRMLRTASPRKASKYGVVPHPIFLGYHKPNDMSRLSGFLGNSDLGLTRDQQKNLRANYLQAMLEQVYELQGVAPEERLPIIQAIQSGEVPMTGRHARSGDILIPHFGVMKLPIDWAGKRRPKLKKGGFIESELNKKEIDNLVKQGYIVEEV